MVFIHSFVLPFSKYLSKSLLCGWCSPKYEDLAAETGQMDAITRIPVLNGSCLQWGEREILALQTKLRLEPSSSASELYQFKQVSQHL